MSDKRKEKKKMYLNLFISTIAFIAVLININSLFLTADVQALVRATAFFLLGIIFLFFAGSKYVDIYFVDENEQRLDA